jgi:hypothetical protein
MHKELYSVLLPRWVLAIADMGCETYFAVAKVGTPMAETGSEYHMFAWAVETSLGSVEGIARSC